MRPQTLVLVGAWLFGALAPAAAEELGERPETVKRSRHITNDEIRRELSALAEPKPGPAPEGDPHVLKAGLERSIEALLPMIERLEGMRSGYASLEDPESLAGERDALRARLLEAQAAFVEDCQRFNTLRKHRQKTELTAILTGAGGADAGERISKAMELETFSNDIKDVRLKTAAVLADDDEAFGKAREAAAQRRRSRRAAAAGAAGLAAVGVLAFVGARFWRRRAAAGAPAAQPGALGPGAQIGPNYKVTREIGRGGMGVVYEAVDISLRRQVAVKQLRSDLREDPKELEAFLAEARLVASLKHPNIVEIHSLVDQGGEVFLVFEFVPGNPLHRVLQRVPRLPMANALAVFRQVGAALDHAHAQRVIHRDLKPANIMVTPQGVAKVMDFGLAHQARLTVAKQTRVEASGTPPYMAPEQETGTVSKESDLYALGVCVYEALAGTLPFPGPNFLVQKRETKPALVSQLAPGIPPSVDLALRRALDPDPAARFHSAAELLAALRP